jgi:hypothetical protein
MRVGRLGQEVPSTTICSSILAGRSTSWPKHAATKPFDSVKAVHSPNSSRWFCGRQAEQG